MNIINISKNLSKRMTHLSVFGKQDKDLIQKMKQPKNIMKKDVNI